MNQPQARIAPLDGAVPYRWTGSRIGSIATNLTFPLSPTLDASIMTIHADNARPLKGTSTTKPGQAVRAPYRFLKRKHRTSDPSNKGVLFSKRVDNFKVIDSFVSDNKVIPCCSNRCCAQLLGSNAELFSSCPTPDESMQRLSFVNAVVGTRTHIHEKGQLESGKRLLARLRIGFTEGMRALPFAMSYSFPGQRGVQQQEYWWRTEEGECVQVSKHNPYFTLESC